MKNNLLVIKFSLICLVSLFVQGCEQDNVAPAGSGKLSLSLSIESRSNSGGRVTASTPKAILISISDQNGQVVEQKKKLPLYAFGNSFITDAMELSTGNYKITEFAVLDSVDHVKYATPKEGTFLAQYVNDALPIDFAISSNTLTSLVPQVIEVNDSNSPADFGYGLFSFDVVQIPMLKSVIIKNLDGYLSIDELTFHYTNGLVKKVDWRSYGDNNYLLDQTELRTYNSYGQLTNVVDNSYKKDLYYYGNSLLSEKVAFSYSNNGSNFVYIGEYLFSSFVGALPGKLQIFDDGGAMMSETQYQYQSGNITGMIEASPNDSYSIEYTNLSNPLRGLLSNLACEYSLNQVTRLNDVLRFSQNLPSKITPSSQLPPTTYTYTTSLGGKKIEGKGFQNGVCKFELVIELQ